MTTVHQEDAAFAHHGKTPKRAALASFMGSAVEYYDFFIFGSAAALIFPHVFFPDESAQAGIMSLATFGFAYIARPVGAVFVGHFGDRIGRQKVLMFTLILMGAATFIIGCIPDFDTIGWWAPAILVFCRLMQGLLPLASRPAPVRSRWSMRRTTAAPSSRLGR
jgi:MFS family permease